MITLLTMRKNDLPTAATSANLLPAQWLAAWSTQHGNHTTPPETLAARQSLAGLLLLQRVGATGELHYTSQGKPVLDQTDLDFSIAHTVGLVVCAVSRRTDKLPPHVGVDAESLSRVAALPTEKLSSRWFTDAEQAAFQASPTHECFARIWTRKEALVKYHGMGLSALRAADTVAATELGLSFAEYRVGEVLISICHQSDEDITI